MSDCVRKLTILDGGDVNPELSLEEGHYQLQQRVQYVLASGAIPWVIGGGNDQSYANVAGLLAHGCQRQFNKQVYLQHILNGLKSGLLLVTNHSIHWNDL
jgi:hypothetical protein